MFVGVLLVAAAQASAATAPAEPTDPPDAIIVTGERSRRTLKDTPSSVAVVTGAEIDRSADDRADQVLARVPNVQLGNGSEGPTIRGQDTTGVLQQLDAFIGGARSRATLEVDGRAVGYQEFVFGNAPLWDVRQVEVFRSPLTVTHGRNSIAGGIVVTTNDPTYDWEERARLIGGNFETREVATAVSGPIVEDQLAFRVAADARHSRTTVRLGRFQRGADPNDDDTSVTRVKLRAEPKALAGFRLVATFNHNYSRMPQHVIALRPFYQRRNANPDATIGVYGIHVDSATLHATQDFGSGTVEAIVSAGTARTRRYALPGVGESRSRFNDASGEVFGDWRLSPAMTLRGGVHAVETTAQQFIDLTQFIGSEGKFRDRQHSFGAYGEVEITPAPRLTLAGGGRYQRDRQRRTGGLSGFIVAPVDLDVSFSAWLPKFTASYSLTRSIKAGVMLQKAYNPGGATLAFDTGETDTFRAETLWNYEAFLKGNLPRLHVSVAANVFYNDMKDAQRAVLVPFTLPNRESDFLVRLNNVPRARAYGGEVELTWRPSTSLTLRGGLGVLRTRIVEPGPSAEIGKEFQRSPHLTGLALFDWKPVRRVQLSASLGYHSSFFSDDFEARDLRVGSAAIVHARAAYQLRRFTLFAYAHNTFDSLHVNYRFSPDEASLDEPRVVGLGLEARF
jgi:outer membrane receptor protein involved in Fe transport